MNLCIRLLTALFCLAFLAVAPVWARTNMFVTDQLQVTVRSGPSVENKVIHVVKSGDRVEIVSEVQENGWVKVRTNGDSEKEGWMIARYLQEEIPALIKIKELDPQNKTLLARMEDLTQENQELKTSLGKAQGRVAELESAYAKLEKDASDVLALRNSHKKLQNDYAAQKKHLGNLSTEVESLRLGGNLKWFLAGAGVLLAGWLIGLAMGRRKRRSSSSLY